MTESDRAFKKDIHPIHQTLDAKAIIQQLEPVSYRRKENTSSPIYTGINTEKIRYGFIANDVQEILPDAVEVMEDDGKLCLDYQALNSILFQVVKDQQKTIDQLEKEVADLKQNFTTMRQDLDALITKV